MPVLFFVHCANGLSGRRCARRDATNKVAPLNVDLLVTNETYPRSIFWGGIRSK